MTPWLIIQWCLAVWCVSITCFVMGCVFVSLYTFLSALKEDKK